MPSTHGAAVGAVAQLPPPTPGPPSLPQAQLRRLLAAYRVGMLALETQARRVHDDRPQNKFGRYAVGFELVFINFICMRLGAQYAKLKIFVSYLYTRSQHNISQIFRKNPFRSAFYLVEDIDSQVNIRSRHPYCADKLRHADVTRKNTIGQ